MDSAFCGVRCSLWGMYSGRGLSLLLVCQVSIPVWSVFEGDETYPLQ